MGQPAPQGGDRVPGARRRGSSDPTLLKALLRDRHLQNFGMFKRRTPGGFFMALRDTKQQDKPPTSARARHDSPHRDGETWDQPLNQINPQHGLTATDPGLLADPALRLLAQLHFGGKRLRGFLPDPDDTACSGHALDGSWFTVDLDPRADGLRAVRQGGPQRLWDTVECSVAVWQRLDQPGIATFRATAYDNDALQYVECDRDPSAFRWPLPL